MAKSIVASVGTGGVNRSGDIITVQELLNRVPIAAGGPSTPLEVDGKTGTKNWGRTANQIVTFQFKCFGWQDGKIDPGGKTWIRLVSYEGQGGPTPRRPSTTPALGGSVGSKGTNKEADVREVQILLNQVPRSSGGPRAPLKADGKAAGDAFKLLVYAIVEFQQRNFGWNDGRIDPGGRSWTLLAAFDKRVPQAAPPPPPPAPPAPKPVAAPPRSAEARGQKEIDEAYKKAGRGFSQVQLNEFAWFECLNKRKRTSIQDTILAAAEHYLYARYQASSGVFEGVTTAIGVGLYDFFKLLPGTSHAYDWWLKTQGEKPASKPTILSMAWGAKGIKDGTDDYIRAEF